MLKVNGVAAGFSTSMAIEPSELRKATCSRGVSADEIESMRRAPRATNLLAWARAVKSTVGMTVVGDVEWSIVTTPRQSVQPPKCGS